MLPRSTLPIQRRDIGLRSLFTKRMGEPSILFVTARPGDEVVAAGGSFHETPGARFLHVTDGAPRDLEKAIEAGFTDRMEFAEVCQREFAAALECAGWEAPKAKLLDFTAEELSLDLPVLTMSLTLALREFQPDVVVTHPYEGLHPDQDAVAFAVQGACEVLEREERPVPIRIEAAGYSDAGGKPSVGQFLTPTFTQCATVILDSERRLQKQCMLERMPIQLARLMDLPLKEESFRVAPRYSFEQAPHDGILHYERCGFEINGRRWRKMASHALRVLGLTVG